MLPATCRYALAARHAADVPNRARGTSFFRHSAATLLHAASPIRQAFVTAVLKQSVVQSTV